MKKNNYAHYIPADRYCLARMLRLITHTAHASIPLEFHIVAVDSLTRGQVTGVWKGTLDQLSHRKGDQHVIPTRLQCELMLDDIFGDEGPDKAELLRLDLFEVREWFAWENLAPQVRYERALQHSRRVA